MNLFSVIGKGISKLASGIKKGISKLASGIKKGVKKVAKKVKDTLSDIFNKKDDGYDDDYDMGDDYKPPIEDVNYYIDKYLSGLSDKKKEEFKNEYENYMSDSSRLNILYNESNLSEFYYGETSVDWEQVEEKINDILNERDEFNQEEFLQNIGDELFDIINTWSK